MAILKPGTGNQITNRKAAIRFLADEIFDLAEADYGAATITVEEGTTYKVSAYAETTAAFVSTPGKDKSEYSIYQSELPHLMVQQFKGGDRMAVYEVNPQNISVQGNSNSAEWKEVERAAVRVWIYKDGKFRVTERG